MRAALFNGRLDVVDVPRPQPAPGEALVRVMTAGVCNTDLEILKGYMGFHGILGHEFVGIVESCANSHLEGKRVVGEINCVCHNCRFCRMELPHHCVNRSVLGILDRNGAFAEYLTLPEENLHIVPDGVRDDVAVFTEPLAAAYRVTEQIDFEHSDNVIVLGAGKLGQLIAQVVFAKTKNLVCVGRNRWKLELLNQLDIPTAHTDDPPARASADYVIEATGSREGLEQALGYVRPEGTIILKTTVVSPTAIDFSVPVVNEVRIIGSRCGPFRPALDALAMGTVEVAPLISETYPLEEAAQALLRAEQGDVMKILIDV